MSVFLPNLAILQILVSGNRLKQFSYFIFVSNYIHTDKLFDGSSSLYGTVFLWQQVNYSSDILQEIASKWGADMLLFWIGGKM